MEIQTISRECVALYVHRLLQEAHEAADLVRSALCLSGLDAWERMEIELFPAGGATLVLARPAPSISVRPADWLLPYISEA